MCPKRGLAEIQLDTMDLNRRLGAFAVTYRMNRCQRSAQFRFVDLVFWLPPLETGLCFGHAILNGFQAVAPGKRSPRTHPMALQNDVCVHQYGTPVPHYRALKIGRRGGEAMRREQS